MEGERERDPADFIRFICFCRNSTLPGKTPPDCTTVPYLDGDRPGSWSVCACGLIEGFLKGNDDVTKTSPRRGPWILRLVGLPRAANLRRSGDRQFVAHRAGLCGSRASLLQLRRWSAWRRHCVALR